MKCSLTLFLLVLLIYLISLCGPNTTKVLFRIYTFFFQECHSIWFYGIGKYAIIIYVLYFNFLTAWRSTVGKNLFTRNPIILFRTLIIIDIMINTIRSIFMIFAFTQPANTVYEFYKLYSYNNAISMIILLMTWKHVAIFGGFGKNLDYLLKQC